MKKKESPERKYLNQYLNPDGTFDEKRYLEDQVRMMCRNKMVAGIVLNKDLTEVHMVSGRIIRYKMKLDV